MLEQRALDLEWANAIAGRRDHIVRTADEPKISVVVKLRAIARDVPFTTERARRLFIILIVAFEQCRRTRRTTHGDIADFTHLELAAVFVDDADGVSRRRLAHRTRTHFHPRQVGDEQRVFGLSVTVENRKAERVTPTRDHFGIERLAGRDAVTQLR